MTAVFKREFGAYFTSPLGYVFVAIFYFFSGAFFYLFTLSSKSTDISMVFVGMFYVMGIFIPVLTMRLMADDRKQKTDQLTLTAPISLVRLVCGKFLAAFAIFAIGVLIMFFYGIVLSFFADINWPMIFGNVVGMILIGAVFIAAGIFISALTENQMIAAVGAIGLNIVFLLIDSLATVIPFEFISNILSALAFYSKYYEFTIGLFSISSILYFVSVIVIFLFLTIRVLEKRRWA